MAEITTKKRRIRPETIIVGLLLLLPVSVAIFCFYPKYDMFIAPGEIVSVQELGVAGSVNFTYVHEGYTRNWFERWTTIRAFPEAQFTAVDSSVEEYFDDMEHIGEEARDETIRNAFNSVQEEEEFGSGDSLADRLEALIEHSTDYYGDSLGLMLAIGLVEEARNEDFSRDGLYIIAGTGTMEEDHTVGSVGAIREKLLTAENFGADYFFVPKDKDYFFYEGLSNEEESALVIEELNLQLEVVPVETLEEAIEFLVALNAE